MNFSLVSLNDALFENTLFRIDAEYFQRKYLDAEIILKKHSVSVLGDISKSIINFGAYSLCNYIEFLEEGVPYLNVGDIGENWIDYIGAKKIDEKLSKKILIKSLTHEGQILLTIAGTIGNSAVAYNLPPFTNSNQAIANITLKDGVSPFYISIYLNSEYGKLQTKRLTISSVQPNLLLTQVKQIKIPILETSFQSIIEQLYKQSYRLRYESQDIHTQAEQIFLSELGLMDWKPQQQLSFVKNFSETQCSERIDAEYYQPIYEEMIEKIKSAKNYNLLGDLVLIKKCVEPGSDAYLENGIPFVRVSNLSKYGINSDNQQYLSSDLYETLKVCQPKQGEILISKDGTPGIAFYLSENPGKMIPSGGILRLAIKDTSQIIPEYLTLVLNSIIIQKQIDRDVGGSVINHWLVNQVKNALVPVLSVSVQNRIAHKIKESFSHRDESKRLLEIAKRGVEMAIERDEKTAQEWMDQEVKSYDCSA